MPFPGERRGLPRLPRRRDRVRRGGFAHSLFRRQTRAQLPVDERLERRPRILLTNLTTQLVACSGGRRGLPRLPRRLGRLHRGGRGGFAHSLFRRQTRAQLPVDERLERRPRILLTNLTTQL